MGRKKQNKKVENTEEQTNKRPIETDDNLNPSQVKKMKKNASESLLS
jgi:hypothetical protein